jgi:hypothetical protein
MSEGDLEVAQHHWRALRRVVTPHTAGGRWANFVELGALLGIPAEELETRGGI